MLYTVDGNIKNVIHKRNGGSRRKSFSRVNRFQQEVMFLKDETNLTNLRFPNFKIRIIFFFLINTYDCELDALQYLERCAYIPL